MSKTRTAIFVVLLLGLLAIFLSIGIFLLYGESSTAGKPLTVTPLTVFAGLGETPLPISNILNKISGTGSDSSSDNDSPTANAGADQTVNEGVVVNLNGSGSYDIDGDTITYFWAQTSGTSVTLSDSTAVSPTFTSPLVSATETLTFQLTVNDGEFSSSDSVTITVNDLSSNTIPVANAGADQTVNEGTSVTLDGSASSDADLDVLTYAWTQTSGTSVTLSDSTAVSPTFTSPLVSATETLVFQLIVNDGTVDSTADTVTITVNDIPVANVPPTANAGADQTVNEGVLVTLDSSASSDSDGTIASRTWTQTSGVSVALSSSTAVSPTFTAPSVSSTATLTFQLIVVDDDSASSTPDSVTITINDVPVPPTNNAPVANDVFTTTNEDTPKVIILSCSDADGDTLTYSIVSNPSSGTLSGTGNVRTYTPNPNFNGADSFTYRCNDGSLNSNTATVTITVNSVDDATVWSTLSNQNVDEDSPAGTVVYSNIMSRVSDIDSLITISVVSSNSHFTLAMSGNDLVINNLESNWYGSATVTLSANGVSASFVLTVNQLYDDYICISGYGGTYCTWM